MVMVLYTCIKRAYKKVGELTIKNTINVDPSPGPSLTGCAPPPPINFWIRLIQLKRLKLYDNMALSHKSPKSWKLGIFGYVRWFGGLTVLDCTGLQLHCTAPHCTA